MLSRNEQHTVSGDRKSGGRFYRVFRAYLRLTDSQQRFFVAEVHLYISALKVSFNDLTRFQFRVRAYKEAGSPIKQLRAFAQTIRQRRDDYQL